MALHYQDFIVIALYFIFIIGIGFIYKNANKDTSDYFRGGGSMSWWMTGASVFMANFSAWTFVAAGGRIYKYGTLIAAIFFSTGVLSIIMALTVVPWFRRMRVITAADALYRRYGRAMEQIYSWVNLIISFLYSGISLYILSVFMSPLLGIPYNVCIIILGATIVFMSYSGGSWAVVASDFVQMLILCVIVVITAVLVLTMPELGGLSGLIEKVPAHQFDWTVFSQEPVLIIYLISIPFMTLIQLFDMTTGASRFMFVKSDKDARKACLVFGIGFIVGPFIWFVPPVVASAMIPDLSQQFGHLKNPEEGAYLAMASTVLPKGMLGMIMCGVFAATMSAMDSYLNKTCGVIVRNIYKPLFNPEASEDHLLKLAKRITLFMGVVMVVTGISYSKLADFSLFQWTQHLNSLVMVPLAIPLSFGLFFRKTPKITPVITLITLSLTAIILKFGIDFDALALKLGWQELTHLERVDFSTALTIIINITLGLIIYITASKLYHKYPLKAEDKERVDSFFKDVNTPVLAESDEHKHTDKMQYKVLGRLCLVYGGALGLGALLPNDLKGRLCFLICGGVISIIGASLYKQFLKLNNTGQG